MRRYLEGIVFAVLWTAGMALWERPDTVGLLILMVCGAIAGVLFHLFAMWLKTWLARRGDRLNA